MPPKRDCTAVNLLKLPACLHVSVMRPACCNLQSRCHAVNTKYAQISSVSACVSHASCMLQSAITLPCHLPNLLLLRLRHAFLAQHMFRASSACRPRHAPVPWWRHLDKHLNTVSTDSHTVCRIAASTCMRHARMDLHTVAIACHSGTMYAINMFCPNDNTMALCSVTCMQCTDSSLPHAV